DDHRLGVEQVAGRGDAGAERLDRPVDQLLGQLVALVEGALPDPARQAVAVVLAHQLEQIGLGAALVLAARVGLHAPLPPARALGAAPLDDHVADLAGGTAAEPRLAVEHQAAADAGAPE